MHHWREWRLDALVVALVFVLCAPVVSQLSAQPAARAALTAAVVEHHTVDVSGYPLGVDYLRSHGRLRSDKAPGQPLLMLPFYAAYRAVGGESLAHKRLDQNLGLWWLTIWSSVLPLCALCVCMRRTARRFTGEAPATFATLAIALGTPALAYATGLFGHVLAAALIFAAWMLASRPDASTRALVLAGVLAGYATITEYPVAVVAGVIAIALWRRRRSVQPFLIGMVPPVVLAMIYQQLAFESPFRTSYTNHVHQTHGLFGIGVPSVAHLVSSFVGSRGLLVTAPVTLVALAAAIRELRTRGRASEHAGFALIVFGVFVVIEAGISDLWIGNTLGPRYMIPVFAFLAIPLATQWHVFGRLAVVTAVWGAAISILGNLTTTLVVPGAWATSYLTHEWRAGLRTPTLLTMPLGNGLGYVLQYAAAALVLLVLIRTVRNAANETVSSPHAAHA